METLQPLPAEAQPPAGSLMNRLLNVFAAPGDVFEEIKSAKTSTANWLVPVLLGCLVGIIYSVVVFSQDNIMQSIRETQEQAIRSKLQKSVDAGKMSKEQVDQAVEMTQRFSGPTLMKVFGSFGAVIFNFGMVFFAGLVVWLVGAKAFRGQFSYMKAVETAGLAGVINVLGGLIAMLLAVMMGNMAMTPGPVLLVHEFNPANKLHVLLSQINLVMLWYLAVLALGLARLSRVSFSKAAAWLFCIWAGFVALAVLPGWGR
jgi:hypothetical protein